MPLGFGCSVLETVLFGFVCNASVTPPLGLVTICHHSLQNKSTNSFSTIGEWVALRGGA